MDKDLSLSREQVESFYERMTGEIARPDEKTIDLWTWAREAADAARDRTRNADPRPRRQRQIGGR